MLKVYITLGDLAMNFGRNQIACLQCTSTVAAICEKHDIINSIKSAKRERRSKLNVSGDCRFQF